MTDNHLSARFQRPEGYVHRTYLSTLGKTIRYGYLPAPEERLTAIHLGGQTQFLEMDYENARDLSRLGITTYFVERYGDGGSERFSPHPQKPPAAPLDLQVKDLFAFCKEITVPRSKKILLFGHCLGGLIALRAAQFRDNFFDHVVLTSPMLGTYYPSLGIEAVKWARTRVTKDNVNKYFGNARDWSWRDAERWLARDKTTHDEERKKVHYLWRLAREDLRLGGFTFGNVIQNSRGLLAVTAPNALENLKTPVTIISAEQDHMNSLAAHREVVQRLPKGQHIILPEAWHGLWREADVWRDQVFEHIESIADRISRQKLSRRQEFSLADKARMWSWDPEP